MMLKDSIQYFNFRSSFIKTKKAPTYRVILQRGRRLLANTAFLGCQLLTWQPLGICFVLSCCLWFHKKNLVTYPEHSTFRHLLLLVKAQGWFLKLFKKCIKAFLSYLPLLIYMERGMLIPNLKSICLYRVKFLRYDLIFVLNLLT